MSTLAIHAEGLSKRYRIGQGEYCYTLRDTLSRFLTTPLRRWHDRRQRLKISPLIPGLPSPVSGLQSLVSGQRSAISSPQSLVSGQRSAVSSPQSQVGGQRSPLARRICDVPYLKRAGGLAPCGRNETSPI